MCGIAGIFHYGRAEGIPEDRLRAMNERLIHRGPDDAGVWLSPDRRVGLAMRRLAIIDTAGGHQPMTNEDGSVHLVFNGEIYNFQALRAELEAKGHRFQSHSDTEALVHLYEEEGVECVRRLRGMFAFSLWDERRKRLFLARDRFGKKPLVYLSGDGRLAWASELQALKVLEWPRDMDLAALDLYLSLQYIPSPKTIYKAVRKLPPAHRLIWEKGVEIVEPYWDLLSQRTDFPGDREEAKDRLRAKLEESVRLRMISDVPLGAFLSGGVDSSVIVGLMSGMSDRPVKTFSIGFEEAEFSELGYARETARRFGTDHTEFIVRPDAAEVLPLLARHYGEPFADASALPTYYVARETRRHVTVALNGDGGDENFAGYLRYMAVQAANRLGRLPGSLRRTLSKAWGGIPGPIGAWGPVPRVARLLRGAAEDNPARRHLEFCRFFTDQEKRDLYGPELAPMLDAGGADRYLGRLFDRAEGLDGINRSLYVDFRSYLPEDLMTKVDIATMAVSLEGRSPLLDHEFVELAFGLPSQWKLGGLSETKIIFKEAFADILPAKVQRRGKMGFGIPLGPWFRGPLKPVFEGSVLAADSLSGRMFRPEALRRFWQDHQTERRNHGFQLWALLMLEMWERHAG